MSSIARTVALDYLDVIASILYVRVFDNMAVDGDLRD